MIQIKLHFETYLCNKSFFLFILFISQAHILKLESSITIYIRVA